MITVSKMFHSVPPLFSHLASIVSGDIDCSHLGLKSHSTDGSPFGVTPQAVLYPKTVSDLKHIIAFAREYRMPLTVCGGQTAASGGSLGEGLLVDLTRYFSHVRQVNTLEHTITVDAGVPIDELIERLDGWNVEIPVLQKEHGGATVGGLVATKSATSSSFYAGTIREWIQGMTVIVDTGEEHRLEDGITPSGRLLGIYQSVFPVLSEHGPTLRAARREESDDATGYALWNTSIGPRQLLDQLVGSEGTLAIITSVTFRVAPKKRHSSTLLLPIARNAVLSVYADIAKHHGAERLFMFDTTFRKLVDTFHSGALDPFFPQTPFAILATFKHDDEEQLRSHVETFKRALPEKDLPITEIHDNLASQLVSPTFLHSLFTDYTRGAHMIATVGEGLIVSPREYGDAVEALDSTLGSLGQIYTLTGYLGSGHIAATTSFDTNAATFEKDIEEYRETLLQTIKEYKMGISASSGDGLERTSLLPFVFNDATREVFKKVKEAWDPLSIFNPSKKISISKDYLREHTIRSLD